MNAYAPALPHHARFTTRSWLIGMAVLVALLPFLAFAVFRALQEGGERRDDAAQDAQLLAQSTASGVDQFLAGMERYLATLAADPSVRAADLPRVTALLQAIREV